MNELVILKGAFCVYTYLIKAVLTLDPHPHSCNQLVEGVAHLNQSYRTCKLYSSIHYLYHLAFYPHEGLEPILADIGQGAGYTLDWTGS